MKDTKWLKGMHQTDTMAPPEEIQGELVYTLYLKDFQSMPKVNFSEAVECDISVKSLLN